jgi:hypothetical protein
MSFVRNKLYSKEYIGLSVAFDTSYGTSKKQVINLFPTAAYTYDHSVAWSGNIQLIRVMGTLSGGASDNITLCGYKNQDGTRLVIEPTQASLIPDISGGKFSAVFLTDAVWAAEDDELSFFIKTQNHTFTLNEIEVTWRNS